MGKKTKYNLPSIEAKIRKAMREQDTYTKSMDIAISLAAGAYFSFLTARDSLVDGKLIKTELSREKHKRFVISPAYTVMITSAELTRKYLRELRLTRATIEGDTGDEFTELIDSVSSVKNAEPTKLKFNHFGNDGNN